MRVRVRKPFKACLGATPRANATGITMVLGGKAYIALALLTLVLTACGGRPSPSPTGKKEIGLGSIRSEPLRVLSAGHLKPWVGPTSTAPSISRNKGKHR